jgi:hypothetical protein
MFSRVESDFLVATPSFFSGAGRLLDWYGLYDLYNVSPNGQVADTKAMFADWRMVGQDLHDAMLTFESTPPVE